MSRMSTHITVYRQTVNVTPNFNPRRWASYVLAGSRYDIRAVMTNKSNMDWAVRHTKTVARSGRRHPPKACASIFAAIAGR